MSTTETQIELRSQPREGSDRLADLNVGDAAGSSNFPNFRRGTFVGYFDMPDSEEMGVIAKRVECERMPIVAFGTNTAKMLKQEGYKQIDSCHVVRQFLRPEDSLYAAIQEAMNSIP